MSVASDYYVSPLTSSVVSCSQVSRSVDTGVGELPPSSEHVDVMSADSCGNNELLNVSGERRHESDDDCVSTVVTSCSSGVDAAHVVEETKRGMHGRSASESGIFKLREHFTSLPQRTYIHRRYEPGTSLFILVC